MLNTPYKWLRAVSAVVLGGAKFCGKPGASAHAWAVARGG